MLCLYSQHGRNSSDDAMLHHLPLRGNFDQDLEYKREYLTLDFLNTRIPVITSGLENNQVNRNQM